MEISLFESVTSTDPLPIEILDEDFMYNWLKAASQLEVSTRDGTYLLSAARYPLGAQRGEKYALDAAVLIMDSDSPKNTIAAARHAINEHAHFGYTSFNHNPPNHERFRLIFPLARTVNADEYKRCVVAARAWLAPLEFDKAPSNIASLFYLPSTRVPERQGRLWRETGNLLSPDQLMARWLPKQRPIPSQALKAMRSALLAQPQGKKQKLKHVSILDSTLIEMKWVNRYLCTERGQHYIEFYRFLCWVAQRALNNNFPLDETLLAEIAAELDALDGGWYWQSRYTHEAQRALAWAAATLIV